MNRPTKSTYYMSIAHMVAARSNCIKRQVGAIIVKNDRIVSTGYNGTPRNYKNCFEGGCPRCNDSSIASGTRLDECLCCHAEENSIAHAAYHGVSLAGGSLYCPLPPCLSCSKLIINVGIVELYYEKHKEYLPNGLAFLNTCEVATFAI